MDALAYDAASVLESALTKGGDGSSRSKLRNQLAEIKDFQGVTGKIKFNKGQFERDLKILTVKGGKAVEAAAETHSP